MIRIELRNKNGSLEIGGSNHPSARLQQIKGIGLPAKEPETVVFAGQPGQIYQSIRDTHRTITMAIDFYGGPLQLEQINKLIYDEVEIRITSGRYRRKIKGICINPEEVESLIYHKWYKLVLQFVCNNPYFNDFVDTNVVISQRDNMFPNLFEDGAWMLSLPAVATVRIHRTGITNYGLINIYPILTINTNSISEVQSLSGSGLEIYNETTDKKIFLEYELKAEENVTVDLPRRKIISDLSGTITNCISDDTVLSDFYLQPGENIISVTNYTSAEVSVSINYNNCYVSAVI